MLMNGSFFWMKGGDLLARATSGAKPTQPRHQAVRAPDASRARPRTNARAAGSRVQRGVCVGALSQRRGPRAGRRGGWSDRTTLEPRRARWCDEISLHATDAALVGIGVGSNNTPPTTTTHRFGPQRTTTTNTATRHHDDNNTRSRTARSGSTSSGWTQSTTRSSSRSCRSEGCRRPRRSVIAPQVVVVVVVVVRRARARRACAARVS